MLEWPASKRKVLVEVDWSPKLDGKKLCSVACLLTQKSDGAVRYNQAAKSQMHYHCSPSLLKPHMALCSSAYADEQSKWW